MADHRDLALPVLGLLLMLGGLGAPNESAAPASEPEPAGRVLSLTIDGPITAATKEYIASGLEKARSERFDAITILLDTPGGYLEATHEIVKGMLASDVPIFVLVGPAGARAGSAGVFITLAGHIAAMHPSSNIGAAHPVTSGGGDVEKEAGKDMALKVENDTAAFARSIAKTRGRNQDWAEKAVRQSISATAEEALSLKVIDLTATDIPALLDKVDGRKVELQAGPRTLRTRRAAITPLEMSIRQRTLAILADPNLAALLMMIGMLGIGLELYHPGSIYPGAIGAFCLLLGLVATQVIPVNIGAILLLVVGAGLLVLEAYVTTHGLAGVGGAICLLLGALLFIDKSSPDYQFDPGVVRISPFVVWPTPIVLAAVMAFVAYKVATSRRAPLVAGAAGLVGQRGEALTDVGSEGGEVFVHGEYWKARSERLLPKGTRVRVISVDGLIALVVADAS